MNTPSKRRRKGQEAFEAGVGLADCPYTNPSYRADWQIGWIEVMEEEQLQNHKRQKFKCIADTCPWREFDDLGIVGSGWTCKAGKAQCEMDNCAIQYFLNRMIN